MISFAKLTTIMLPVCGVLSGLEMPVFAAENCMYQLSEEEPYYIHGSLVTPQSSVMVLAECGKTIDQVRAERDAEIARRQEETSRLRSGGSTGNVIDDHEALQALRRARDQLLHPTPGESPMAVSGDPSAPPVTVDGADLFVDWRQYLGKRVAVRGIAHMADSQSVLFDSGSASFVLDLGGMETETKRFFLKNCDQLSMDVPSGCETTISVIVREMSFGMVHLAQAQMID